MTSNAAYDALMHEICVGLGFCGCIKDDRPLHVDLFIPASGPVTADQFVEWVFLADGMNPRSEYKGWKDTKDKLRQAFVRHMGAEEADAAQLRWSSAPYTPRQLAGPTYRKIEAWRVSSENSAVRYNCLQNISTGEYRVCTVDFVYVDGTHERDQARYFLEVLTADDAKKSEPLSWFTSLESAIADHDEIYGN